MSLTERYAATLDEIRAAGLYDDWVKKSFAELARLKPARYGKAERTDAALPPEAAKLNQQGIGEDIQHGLSPFRA